MIYLSQPEFISHHLSCEDFGRVENSSFQQGCVLLSRKGVTEYVCPSSLVSTDKPDVIKGIIHHENQCMHLILGLYCCIAVLDSLINADIQHM